MLPWRAWPTVDREPQMHITADCRRLKQGWVWSKLIVVLYVTSAFMASFEASSLKMILLSSLASLRFRVLVEWIRSAPSPRCVPHTSSTPVHDDGNRWHRWGVVVGCHGIIILMSKLWPVPPKNSCLDVEACAILCGCTSLECHPCDWLEDDIHWLQCLGRRWPWRRLGDPEPHSMHITELEHPGVHLYEWWICDAALAGPWACWRLFSWLVSLHTIVAQLVMKWNWCFCLSCCIWFLTRCCAMMLCAKSDSPLVMTVTKGMIAAYWWCLVFLGPYWRGLWRTLSVLALKWTSSKHSLDCQSTVPN